MFVLLYFHGFIWSIDHRRMILFFAFLIFAVGLNREIILTAKFCRSTVFDFYLGLPHMHLVLLLPCLEHSGHSQLMQHIKLRVGTYTEEVPEWFNLSHASACSQLSNPFSYRKTHIVTLHSQILWHMLCFASLHWIAVCYSFFCVKPLAFRNLIKFLIQWTVDWSTFGF